MSDKVLVVEGTARINLEGTVSVYRKVGDKEPMLTFDLSERGEITSEIDVVEVIHYKNAMFHLSLPLEIVLPDDE